MSIQYIEMDNHIVDTDSCKRCQPPSVAPGQLMCGFDGRTHLVHSVVVHNISNHPHAISRCGRDYTVGGSTMCTSRAPDGDPTCDECLHVEGAPDVVGEMHVGRFMSVDERIFEGKLLSEVIFRGGEVVEIRSLHQVALR